MLSIIIPSKDEPYLNKTIEDLLKKSEGDIEILVNIDGTVPEDLIQDKRVSYTYCTEPKGMRNGINEGLKRATGEFIMKVDGHCAFGQGYDRILTETFEDNWLVIPRRYSLHADNWDKDERMPVKDYHYLTFPHISRSYGCSIFPQEWKERTYERLNKPGYMIDDTMTFQGSCYVAKRDYFMSHVGLLDDSPDTYTSFSGEPLEVGLKYWLGGGEVKVNKHTWYAHLFKNSNYYKDKGAERKYKVARKTAGGHSYSGRHWMMDEEPNMKHPFSWLVEKFWPVPTWPEDRNTWKYPL